MQGKSLAFFWRALERQQENGLLINPESFAPSFDCAQDDITY